MIHRRWQHRFQLCLLPTARILVVVVAYTGLYLDSRCSVLDTVISRPEPRPHVGNQMMGVCVYLVPIRLPPCSRVNVPDTNH